MVCMLVWTGPYAGEVEWYSAAIRASMLCPRFAMYSSFLYLIAIYNVPLALIMIRLDLKPCSGSDFRRTCMDSLSQLRISVRDVQRR